MKHTNCSILKTALLLSFLTTTFVSIGQAPHVRKDYRSGILSIAYFIESANNSINSLSGLLKKDNYRNRIASLNNPTNSELGFSLKTEILNALKPLLDKARRTDSRKFKEVIENFLNNPDENGIRSVKKYMPALGIFSTVLSLVGNLVIAEKTISKDDLNNFIAKIQQYFSQYEKLNTINEQFSSDVQKLLDKADEIKDDLKSFLIDCICSLAPAIKKPELTGMPVEILLQKYYDPQKLQYLPDTAGAGEKTALYPPDAPTSIRLLASGIRKLQKEFEILYSDNHRQLNELIASLKTTIPNLDQQQLEKTNNEMDKLYSDSRQADIVNLNMNRLDERMDMACRVINSPKQ